MFRLRLLYSPKRNYRRSKALALGRFAIDQDLKTIAQGIVQQMSAQERQHYGQLLLDGLSQSVGIPTAHLTVSEARQYHRKSRGRVVMRQYGYYRPHSNYIYITNRTAVRGQVLAGKTFLGTVLHEWLHHYETHKLHLNSIHTTGFYERLRTLTTRLEVQ